MTLQETARAIKSIELTLNVYYKQWDDVFNNGDPTSDECDGQILSHIRNLIIYNKKKLEYLIDNTSLNYPDVYFKETPQEVSKYYVVNRQEVTVKAKEALKTYEQSEDFTSLLFMSNKHSENILYNFYVNDCIDVTRKLNSAIMYGDVAAMRKFSDIKAYLKAFKLSLAAITQYERTNSLVIESESLYHLKKCFS